MPTESRGGYNPQEDKTLVDKLRDKKKWLLTAALGVGIGIGAERIMNKQKEDKQKAEIAQKTEDEKKITDIKAQINQMPNTLDTSGLPSQESAKAQKKEFSDTETQEIKNKLKNKLLEQLGINFPQYEFEENVGDNKNELAVGFKLKDGSKLPEGQSNYFLLPGVVFKDGKVKLKEVLYSNKNDENTNPERDIEFPLDGIEGNQGLLDQMSNNMTLFNTMLEDMMTPNLK